MIWAVECDQRYILCKGPLPLDIEFDLQDLFRDLRPNMTRYSTIEEDDTALVHLEEHERSGEKHHTEQEKPRSMSGSSSTVNGQVVVANAPWIQKIAGQHVRVDSVFALRSFVESCEDFFSS
ncbi:unnamed protein product [Lactuca saligna]|uniref:Uncharacterized protein n=1 Tax=Lactuca saligna TaxID=75948 RepID=A0AA36E0M1_LACSI|nr:unnamed protein product [Lactuca saligna]